ncbi:DUF4321 domain-containing protein [Peptococcaceae bacterium 1198_IL3148]
MARGGFSKGRSAWLLFLLLLSGGVAGSALGATLAPILPLAKNFFDIGLTTTSLDMNFFSVSFGLTLAVGPFTALGLILGYVGYRKL